jgi:uncharacterized protein (DUF1778 family)
VTVTKDSISLFGADLRTPPRGRPRVAEPMAPISVRFKASEHDQIIKAALERGMSVTGFMRAAVLQAVRRP